MFGSKTTEESRSLRGVKRERKSPLVTRVLSSAYASFLLPEKSHPGGVQRKKKKKKKGKKPEKKTTQVEKKRRAI